MVSTTTQSSSNVRVVARIRPLAQYELENGSKAIVSCLPSLACLQQQQQPQEQKSLNDKENVTPASSSPSYTGPTTRERRQPLPTEPEVLEVQPIQGISTEKRWFELDAVLDGQCSQHDVYWKSGAQQAVTVDIFKGFNCTILAYGQTGAGKTFTMGTASGSANTVMGQFDVDDGIIPRSCYDLFEQINTRCDGNAQVEMSYLEIYNEEIRDLMVNQTITDAPDLKIRETLNGEVYVGGLSSKSVRSPKEIGDAMEVASQRRVVASTKMNAVSSRSHAICVLRIKGVLEDSTKFEAKLTLVDLAGSERIKKTGASGGRRQEGININKGLFVLGQVVSALSEQRPKYKRKPPYRDSKLTRLLQDSLGGNSRTIMVACVSPADFNIDETINTLRYATSARNIKNTATRNVIKALSPEEAAKLQRENQLLLTQVRELQETIRKMATATGESPSLASTDDSEGEDDMLDDTTSATTATTSSSHLSAERNDKSGNDTVNDDSEATKSWKRIKELEDELRQYKQSGSKRQSSVTAAMAQEAIELPVLHKRVATLEEELKGKAELDEENMLLREELEEVKADAASARVAANKMAKIMDQLKELKGDEVDKKKMEHDHLKVEEAWVSFVFQVLETNKEQMRRLREDFSLVARVVESPDVMVPTKSSFLQKVQKKIRQTHLEPSNSGDSIEMKVNPEIRQKLVSEHLLFFEERMVEMEGHVHGETESLASIRDSLRAQRDRLEVEIGTSEFERDSLNHDDTDLLNQLTCLLIGPVKNLGEFE
jgi:hypothetical protein